MRTLGKIGYGVALSAIASVTHARAAVDTRCIVASGGAAARCVRQYARAVGDCRSAGDAACETALRAPAGKLAAFLAATEKPIRDECSSEAADRLTSLFGLDDLVSYTAQACRKWGDDFVDTAFADDTTNLSPDASRCQRLVAAQLARVRDTVVQAFGRRCFVAEFAGKKCHRSARDRRVGNVRARAGRLIAHRCGPTFDTLGLVSSASGAMLDDRVDVLVNIVATRSRHLAERVYPPLSLGPTALIGPHPVGVRTLTLTDPSRSNPAGTGPRTLVTEIYYPSTPEAVAGVPRDVVNVLGIPLFPTPTYRDVARAAGTFPLVVYSPGSGGPRFDHLVLMLHLASHGFVAVGVDHEGNDLLDSTGDADTLVNRPRDISALLDHLLAFDQSPGHFLEGALDPERIGAYGHSYGGYTMFALAAGPFGLGTFTDPRIKAIMPLDGSAQVFEDTGDSPAIFSTIHVPTLLMSGTLSPFLEPRLQVAFDTIPAGPPVVALADLRDAGHSTFTDVCEVPDDILTIAGGVPLDCQPVSVPWRYARHIVDYLALNFFDGVLNHDAEALARLDPATLASIEGLRWQAK